MTQSARTTQSSRTPTVVDRWARALERTAIISAWIGTILVPTGFAKIAIAPVVLMLLATLAGPSVRRLWWAAIGFAAVYAIPFTMYAVNPNRAPSLSKDMDLIWWVVIPVVGVVYLVAYYRGRRRAPSATDGSAADRANGTPGR